VQHSGGDVAAVLPYEVDTSLGDLIETSKEDERPAAMTEWTFCGLVLIAFVISPNLLFIFPALRFHIRARLVARPRAAVRSVLADRRNYLCHGSE